MMDEYLLMKEILLTMSRFIDETTGDPDTIVKMIETWKVNISSQFIYSQMIQTIPFFLLSSSPTETIKKGLLLINDTDLNTIFKMFNNISKS